MPLLTSTGVAALLNLSDRQVRRLAAAGVLTGIRYGKRGRWTFSEAYIKGLVAGVTEDSTSHEDAAESGSDGGKIVA